MEKEKIFCSKCDNSVVKEKNQELRKEYPYYCEDCDENLYSFETYTK